MGTDAGASMLNHPAAHAPPGEEEGKAAEEEREQRVQEIIASLASGEAVAKVSLEIEEALVSALKGVSPDVETVKAQLGKAKKGVDQISLWAEELYKQGVSVEDIKDLLAKAGLTPMEESKQ